MKAQMGSRGVAILSLTSAVDRGGLLMPRPDRFIARSGVRWAEWAPEPVWPGAENLAPTTIRSPNRQPLASRYTDYALPAYDATPVQPPICLHDMDK